MAKKKTPDSAPKQTDTSNVMGLSAQGVERLTIPKIFSRLLEEMLMAG